MESTSGFPLNLGRSTTLKALFPAHPPMSLRTHLLPVALVCLASPAWSDVLVVDDDGGPGVDFTQIAAAAAAAEDGDILCVREGSYSNFFIDGKGLTLIGEPGAVLNGDCIIRNLVAGQDFTISSLENLSIWFADCDGRVVLDQVTTGTTCCSAPLLFTQCADVRVQRSILTGNSINPNSQIVEGAFAQDTRIEFVGCTLVGQDGGDPSMTSSPRGAASLTVIDSRAHVAESLLRGGDGLMTFGCLYSGGSGGPGMDVRGAGSEVVLAGSPVQSIVGGNGGESPQNQCDGLGASAVELLFSSGASLRSSGLTLSGGADPSGNNAPDLTLGGGTTVLEPAELDPTVTLLTTPVPGQTIELRITGEPGASVVLFASQDAALIPDPQSAIEQLTTERRVLPLGLLPATGELTRSFLMPAGASIGTTYWVQAGTLSPSGDFERSNSAALILR